MFARSLAAQPLRWFCFFACCLVATVATAIEPPAKLRKVGEYNPADSTVEMFEAVNAGQLEVKMIPKDSTQGRVLITNKTKQPLNIKLPAAFAAVPVLAQRGRGGMGGM